MIRKVREHPTQNEPLLFESSSPGKLGYQLPNLDVPPVDAREVLGDSNTRADIEGFPEVSEVEVDPSFHATLDVELRHRPRPVPAGLLHHEVQPARERSGGAGGWAGVGPSVPAGIALSQGAMERDLRVSQPRWLEITGMDVP
jgi:glycine dehydrogenase subunit 2